MHREIAHDDLNFAPNNPFPLYFLTGLVGVLIGADLWPAFADWAAVQGWSLPSWPREFLGYPIVWIAAVLGGVRVLYITFEGLFQGKVGADLALTIAYVAALLFRRPLVAAEIVFIGMVGECLESVTFARTQRAVRQLVEIFPRRCWLLRDGQEVRVFTRELHVGDRVVVKPGARIPVDGVVIEGRSTLDTSALTGESLPVERQAGDEVLAGTINQVGALVIEAQRVAEQTVAGRVIELTARALQDKAALERTADRLARYFLPVVLGVAALTFVGAFLIHLRNDASGESWTEIAARSIDPVLAVLVVACPCPLILATPAAVIAALGRLAGTGILIKGGSALERLASVQTFAFDKTGTLTEGRLALAEVIPCAGVTAEEVLRVAAAAEQRSEHPLARLIVHEASKLGRALEGIEDFEAHPGAGVQARIGESRVVVGTRRLLEERGISVPAELSEGLEALERAGQTTLLVARDGQVLGGMGARDQVRAEAPEILDQLHGLGIRDILLLTGDRTAAAQTVARELGITQVYAELLPQDKARLIADWSGAGKSGTDGDAHLTNRIAMVGDGINDAPALGRADVGLALGGRGTDIAAEAGDIVLMGDPLRHLPLLVRLSRETVRLIRQNILIFAFGVNGLGVILTAWLWPLLSPSATWQEQGPLAAVLYHQVGSIAVLINAMRLLWFERPGKVTLRARGLMGRVDEWMQRAFDLHEFSHWLEHHRRGVAMSATVLALAGYALSGLTAVHADELTVVRRFGRVLRPALEPGLYWRYPWPMESVTRVQVDRVRTAQIGFRSTAVPDGTLTWGSVHPGGRDAEEAVMITGDGNLVEIQATVRYTIDRNELERYLFEVSDPDEVVRTLAESVLRESVGGSAFLELLTSGRERFQQEALRRLEQRCRAFGSQGLGIHLQGLALHDLHPPQEVVPSYHEVTKAMEVRDRRVNEAEAQRIRDERAAQVKQQQLIHQSEAAAEEIVALARAAADRFLARWRMRSTLSGSDEWQGLSEAIRTVTVQGNADLDVERNRQDRLARQKALTDFRQFWTVLGQSLGGREKVIIDAEDIPGRRQLFLADPEQFRVPVPMLNRAGSSEKGRSAGRGGGQEELHR